jgi:arsenite/tail-anchored protein-transporting ATPase
MSVRRASVRPPRASVPPPPPLREPFARRLQLFTGKGGVGKSSVVAALALEAAARGLKPLIVELGHRASMEGVFGHTGIGYEPTGVGHGVNAMNMDFQNALVDYMTEHVKVKAISKAIVDNRALRGFFDAAPAVPEVVTLNRLRQLLEARQGSSPRHDPILVDLDATGHALMLLELPVVLDGLIGGGPLRRLLASLSTMIRDPALTQLHIVTLPGELPAQETLELYAKLVARRVPLGALIVNQVPEAPFGPEVDLLDELEARARSTGQSELLLEIALGRRALVRQKLASAVIDRLTEALPLPVIKLPLVPGSGIAVDDLQNLGRLLVGSAATVSGTGTQ